ncbi:MAG: translesion error-prone DNA polymerase V autoproteolytic subunit [Alphaproteobacteria bacterium]|nr:translesion error-prone DNA polymerase V autoproteolytic subunit [Alphaproteobacteria bacterium]
MGRGGSRPGAGRKVNSGIFGEKTVAKRIPISLVDDVEKFIHSLKGKTNKNRFKFEPMLQEWGPINSSNLNLPLFESRVSAGFPSPADDREEDSLDLNQHLIQHPAATFFVRASGESMINAGINNNDILIVDRSLEPKHGDIIIAALNGELTVKRLHLKGKMVTLMPDNPDYPAIEITEEINFLIWGVVTSVVHQY